jgi:GNAT superfamily N-acetyltransferase
MSIKIRQSVEADFPRLLELFKEFATFEGHPEMVSNSVELMHLEKDLLHAFVAETSADGIVGYVTYFYSYPTWKGKSMYMDDLYVVPGFRGKGLGSLLTQTLIDFAKSSGCKKLHWQVSDWNQSAIGFYESLGAKIDRNKYNCDLLF